MSSPFLALGVLYLVQGFPYGLQSGLLPVLLRTQGLSLAHIGLTRVLYLPWLLKFLWSPLVDGLWHRQAWLVLSTGGLCLCCALCSLLPLQAAFTPLAWLLLVMHILSSVQDVALDAVTVAVLEQDQLGLGNSIQVVAYKLGSVLAGGGALTLLNALGWRVVFLLLSAGYFVAVLCAWRSGALKGEGSTCRGNPKTSLSKLRLTDVAAQVLRAPGTTWTIVYVVIYKLGEQGSLSMVPLLLLDQGVSPTELGVWNGMVSLGFSIAGSAIGGALLRKGRSVHSLLRTLFVFRISCLALQTVLLTSLDRETGFVKVSLLLTLVLQNFLAGVITTGTFTLMMHCTRQAHKRVQDEETERRSEKSKHHAMWAELDELESSDDSSRDSGSEDEAAGFGDHLLGDLSSPLSEFLAFKQESASDQPSATNLEKPTSPLLTVMSHLITFLEHYSQMQRLQGKAQEYRVQLQREERRRKKQLRNLREAYKQRMKDKMSLIEGLESVICEQQSVLERLQRGVLCSAHPISTLPPVGVHKLVESISVLQLERSQLQEEVGELKQDIEQKEKEQQQVSDILQQQIEELKGKIQEREVELSQLRAEMGATDSEKQIHNLSVENENLKQNLNMTQGLLEKLAAVNSQPSAQLLKENEDLRSKVHHLETSLQDKVEQLVYAKGHMDNIQWRKDEETRQLQEKVERLRLSLENEKKRPPDVQYVTQTVEVESPTLLRSLEEAEERNRTLQEQVSDHSEKCQRLEEQLHRSEDLTATLQSKISAYESQIGKLKEELMQEIQQLEAQKDEAIKEASDCSEQHMEQLRRQLLGMQSRLASLQPILKNMKTNYNSLRSQVRNFSQFYEASIREARRQICHAVTDVSEANKDLLQKYQREMQLRKRYHDQLVELKGNIRVLCRVRPHLETGEEEAPTASAIITDTTDDTKLSVVYKGKERNFTLDKVFLPHTTQEEVFQEIEPVVMSCIHGYNVCIFAYGQTGSGKTYTMEGTAEKPGINQQALQALYQEMEARRGLWSYSVSLSMVEIYNEVIRDLLSKDPQEKLDIKLHPDGSGQLHVPGLTSKEVKSFRHIKKLLSLGKRNRATFCTNMNERSSRSHALLTLTLTGQELSSGSVTTGKLNLVDLAGSERVSKSGAEGDRLKEAQNINKSLLALGEVIQALRAKQGHVPFRNSRLTYLLQDSLGKGNKTVMMVQVSPLESNLGETVCSLNFAQRVCKVELGPASRKIDASRSEI